MNQNEIIKEFERVGVSVIGIKNDYNNVWLVDVPEIHPDHLIDLSERGRYGYIQPNTEKHITVVVKA